jgi:acetyl esterase/lipase
VPARASLDAPVLDCVLPPRPLQSAQPGTASRVEHDVAYGPDPAQRFDVALPAPAAQGPAPPWVVLVHGGGWTAGDKRLYWPQLAILSSLGYAAATVNYRLARDPSRAFPVPPSDVACALAAIARESPRLGADGDRMVLVGGSSGGHLVALVAVAQNDPAVLGVCADRFPTPAGVVAFYPPLELRGTAARYPERLNMAVEELFRLPPGTAAWQRATTLATPVAQLPPPGSAANLGLPPFLLIAAGSDVIVPADDTRVFHQSLRDRGVPSLLVEVPGAGHGFPILGRGASQRPATCTLLEFLRRALGPR